MCFSAQASFIASGALLFIGILTSFKVKSLHHSRNVLKLVPLALIPYFFAIQQASEGFLWLALTHRIDATFASLATYTFLFFAYIFWPLWMPISLFILEKNRTRKQLILSSFIVGILVAGYNAFYLITYGALAKNVSHHIAYNTYISTVSSNISLFFYCLAVILPLCISSIPHMCLYGILVFASLVISYIAYTQFLTSIWCFFGALLSILIYWIISQTNKINRQY